MAVETAIICIPTRGQVLDVVRTTGQVIGYVIYEPWERAYAVRSLDGRLLKAGLSLNAAQDYAITEVSW